MSGRLQNEGTHYWTIWSQLWKEANLVLSRCRIHAFKKSLHSSHLASSTTYPMSSAEGTCNELFNNCSAASFQCIFWTQFWKEAVFVLSRCLVFHAACMHEADAGITSVTTTYSLRSAEVTCNDLNTYCSAVSLQSIFWPQFWKGSAISSGVASLRHNAWSSVNNIQNWGCGSVTDMLRALNSCHSLLYNMW